MITKLVQLALLSGALAGSVLLYLLLMRLSETGFTLPSLLILIGAVAAYLYGATTFMALRGIRFFSRTK